MAHVAHVARVAHVAQSFGSCELFAHHRGTMEYHFLTLMKKIRHCLGRKACQLVLAIPHHFRIFSLQFLTCPQQRPRETNYRVGMGAGCRCRLALLGSQGCRVDHRGGIHIDYQGEGPKHDQLQICIDLYRFVQYGLRVKSFELH